MATLNYLNKILRTWKDGVRWTVWNSLLRNDKLSKWLRKNNHFFASNTESEDVDEFRDLGAITDHHIRWHAHVNCVVAMANRMLGLIKRTCKGLNNLKTLGTLYCSLVGSSLYSALLYGTHIHVSTLRSLKESSHEPLDLFWRLRIAWKVLKIY